MTLLSQQLLETRAGGHRLRLHVTAWQDEDSEEEVEYELGGVVSRSLHPQEDEGEWRLTIFAEGAPVQLQPAIHTGMGSEDEYEKWDQHVLVELVGGYIDPQAFHVEAERMSPLIEHFDSPYRYRANFETEEIEIDDADDEGTPGVTEQLKRVQIVRFQSDDGTPYLWYARQSRFAETSWEIAFGLDQGTDSRGASSLNLNLTGKGNAFRVMATVAAIVNSFTEFGEMEIQEMTFTSEGDKRTRFYLGRIIPLIDRFRLVHQETVGGETSVTLGREW